MRTVTDAEATIKHLVLMAIVDTAYATGLRAGSAVDDLVDEILINIKKPETIWAFEEITKEIKNV